MHGPRVSEVRLVPASAADQESGLLGFISFLVDDALRVDGVTLRRTLRGEMTLSYPKRTDSEGRDHPIVRPVTTSARLAVEEQVLRALPGVIEADRK